MDEVMEQAKNRLVELTGENATTRGMYVRAHGKHLVLGREEQTFPEGRLEKDDRVRLTSLHGHRFGLSVKRHTGKWEKTPFTGTVEELFEMMLATMQHLIADWP